MYYGSLFFGMQPQLIYAKKTYIISLLTIVRIIINVALNIPFIIKWGAIGAAWATLLAGLISGAISFIVAQHYYEIKWQYRQVAAIFLTFLGSSLMVILLRNAGLSYIIRIAVKLASLSLYIFIGIKIKFITAENYTLVKNMFRKFSFS